MTSFELEPETFCVISPAFSLFLILRPPILTQAANVFDLSSIREALMHSKPFFDGWVGRLIELGNSDQPSTWRLVERLGDKNDQLSAEEHNVASESNISYGKPSAAYGAFRCQNTSDPDDVAFMKIIMQIPWAGAEFVSSTERAKQADNTNLPRYAQWEIEPLEILTKNNCQAAPHIRTHRETVQEQNEMVPGGFIHYILMEHAPGDRLTEDKFWNYPDDERNKIREAFRVAWEECVRAGVVPCMAALWHLFWDSESSKVYLVGFNHSQPVSSDEDDGKWEDNEWIYWGLAQYPDEENYAPDEGPNADKSKWIL
ncbi:uncharacterized protein DSM5745_06068 [Aspergillus mulundensis]|uniref:Uncharacterized protein n=1 Tax=Aspergillus mulundensis TaxID=1810919 RepID=A0A3D8RYV6_9EURO|nr:hypothetical protein DSM5745_06068 [Aspergillus mulundensis]RDW79216.1 hypothetical protein DSM5745_06068 [Aspergillus mulundensis]